MLRSAREEKTPHACRRRINSKALSLLDEPARAGKMGRYAGAPPPPRPESPQSLPTSSGRAHRGAARPLFFLFCGGQTRRISLRVLVELCVLVELNTGFPYVSLYAQDSRYSALDRADEVTLLHAEGNGTLGLDRALRVPRYDDLSQRPFKSGGHRDPLLNQRVKTKLLAEDVLAIMLPIF